MEWRIFFIGPMQRGGQTASSGSGSHKEARSSRDHFSQMVAAVTAELEALGYQAQPGRHQLSGGTPVSSLVFNSPDGLDQVTLIQPHELFGPHSIQDNVFDAIDDSDLVIADLTEVRGPVVYELAFAHALGIWTILLSSGSDADLMFYLRGRRHALVDFAATDIRSDEFRAAFRAWLDGRNKRFDSSNPFTDFYGAPIPDISAASGLANGYYENFLRRVLAPGSKLVIQDGGAATQREISGVLVVRPVSLQSLADLIRETGEALSTAFPASFHVGRKGVVYAETTAGDRTCEFVVDGWLVDIPRTVMTLERSPRLKRTKSQTNSRAHDHMSEVLVERFLEGARTALDVGDDGIERMRERFFYGNIQDVVRFLQLPSATRPSVWPTT